jgi:hypothetical protein
LEKLAPIVHHALEEWLPNVPIELTDDYVFIGEEHRYGDERKEIELKVSRRTCCVWSAHHGTDGPWGDILNLFQILFDIDDEKKAWKKLDAIRRRLEKTKP